MDFEKICMIFTMQEPYYGILLSSMDRRETKKLETIGVAKSGNVFKLYYNPDFISTLSVDTTLEVLKHEMLHVAFNHFTLWEDNNVPEGIHHLRNVAEDMEINCYLDRQKLKEVGGVFPEDRGFDRKLGARAYYKLLHDQMEQERQQAQAQQPQLPCNGGQGGQSGQQNQQSSQSQNDQSQSGAQNSSQSGQNGTGAHSGSGATNSDNMQPRMTSGPSWGKDEEEFAGQFNRFDDHSVWPETESQAELDNLRQMVEDLMVFAAEEVEKGRGEIPGELKGKITEIRNRKKPKPVADWKRYFRRYIGNEFSEFTRKSRKRESKRFPDAAGTRHRRKSHILVGIDTSGSVSMPEYREFCGQMRTLMDHTTFHVIECDSVIQHEYEFNGKIHEELHGGGGTEFSPVIDRFLEEKRKYEGLVYFTDGYCSIPKNCPKECLWVISSKGDHNRPKYQVNGAKAVFITNQNK